MDDKIAEREVRLIESIKKQGRDEAYNDGCNDTNRKLIKNAFRKHSVKGIAELFDMSVSEVRKYLEM